MNKLSYGLALFLCVFGALTLFMSSAVIFDLFGIRELEGNYVLFIVWANFVCGFLYIITSFGVFKGKDWTALLLLLAVGILLASFIGLGFYISFGGVYETKTLKAMVFRITFTVVFVFLSRYIVRKKHKTFNQ